MRTARLVGLSQDGMSLIVATDSGEELAIPADDRLRAALRGDRPRLGQLEIEMDSSLGPRDIQARMRAGASLEDVARVAGIPLDRVERFAAPVLAEREHVAILAMSSSVRRRGETSGHRNLRVAVTERLLKRGVDIDTIEWDSYRLEDGHWSVSAEYRSGETNRKAVFIFDVQGRFSVADNDEARWALGEHSSLKGPQPGRRRSAVQDDEPGDSDTEPTLDLSDELALVRVIQGPELLDAGAGQVPTEPPVDDPQTTSTSSQPPAEGLASVRALHPVPDEVMAADSFAEQPAHDEDLPSEDSEESPLETLASMLRGDRPNEEDGEHQNHDGREEAPATHGLSDASAVPETDNSGWEPGIVVNYPVEPSQEEPSDEPGWTDHAAHAGTDTPAAAEPPVEGDDRAEEAQALEDESHEKHQPAQRPAARRKRAAVPSWDEIMFGGPKRSG